MKKTIIAAAIATVVAAPAMADVSVSGQVKVTVADTENAAGDWSPSYDNFLNFKASEDLGNGMSAFAQLSLDVDAQSDLNSTTAGTTSGTKDMKLGVKGGFGTIVAGSIETLTEGVMAATMDDGAGTGGIETGLTNLTGRNNTIAYISPTVNGVHVAVAGVMDGTATGLAQSTDMLIAYDNGPLAVKAAHIDIDGGTDVTTFAASYTMGDVKVSYLTADDETSGDRDNMYRLDYKMGNNSILLGHLDDETANSDVTSLKLTHSLSKRTKVWVGARDKGTAHTGDVTHFGMIHKF